MEVAYSSAQLERAKLLQRAILQSSDRKRDIDQVFKEFQLCYKRKTCALKKKYEEKELSGLISQKQKCGKKARKFSIEVRNYVHKLKQNAPKIKGRKFKAKSRKTMVSRYRFHR